MEDTFCMQEILARSREPFGKHKPCSILHTNPQLPPSAYPSLSFHQSHWSCSKRRSHPRNSPQHYWKLFHAPQHFKVLTSALQILTCMGITWASQLKRFNSLGLGGSLRTYISNKLLGNSHAAARKVVKLDKHKLNININKPSAKS